MRFIALPRADGTTIYVNPVMVRAVVEQDKSISYLQFDQDHVVMLREKADKIVEMILASAATPAAQ